jgi:hypothetical protein
MRATFVLAALMLSTLAVAGSGLALVDAVNQVQGLAQGTADGALATAAAADSDVQPKYQLLASVTTALAANAAGQANGAVALAAGAGSDVAGDASKCFEATGSKFVGPVLPATWEAGNGFCQDVSRNAVATADAMVAMETQSFLTGVPVLVQVTAGNAILLKNSGEAIAISGVNAFITEGSQAVGPVYLLPDVDGETARLAGIGERSAGIATSAAGADAALLTTVVLQEQAGAQAFVNSVLSA